MSKSYECHTARFVVGQNLYIYKQSRKSAATNWTRSITDWYDEVELFGKERVKPFKFSTDVGNHLKSKICIIHLWVSSPEFVAIVPAIGLSKKLEN